MIEGLTWLAITSTFKKVVLWCKKYWQLLLGISIPIILMVIFRNKPDLSKVIERINEDYKKEIDIIDNARKQEIRDREKALALYRDAILEIESNYTQESDRLDKKKKKMIESIILENSKDPDTITKRISEITGFDIHIL
jgi:hypothetical protein